MKKKGILRLAKRIVAGMLGLVVCVSAIGETSLVVRATENTEVTVTTKEEFLVALEQKKSPIIVNGVISADNGADTTGKMYPVYIPEGTVIRGGTANSEGEGPSLSFRSPIQLTGSDVVIENIQMQFSSATALGSVPHREIFLAGYSLTLDNVSTYQEGAGGSLGGLGGSESELLPTVYAGGFEGTTVGTAASLTIQNANEDTVLQAIYMGHDTGTDSKVAYTGQTCLQIGEKVSIRGGIFTEVNSSASVEVIGEGEETSSNNLNNVSFYGNADTTLTVKNICLNKTTISNVGNLVLDDSAVFELSSGSFNNIMVKNGACLNLNGVQDVIASGNFMGGAYDEQNSTDTRGILVLNKEGSLTIEGTVKGETLLQTTDKNFPGDYLEKTYVSSAGCEDGENGFVLPAAKTGGYELTYENNNWMVEPKNLDVTVTEIEVVSHPAVVDINTIIGTDFVPAENAPYCEIVWKDADGNALDAATVDAMMLYYYDKIIAVKTEYWGSEEASSETDWANPIEFAISEDAPGKYYFYVDEANTALSGTYTFILLSESAEPDTVTDVKELKDSGMVLAEFEVAFYNSAKGESAPLPNPDPTPEPDPNPEPDPTPIDIAGENITVSTIENQTYTGNEICPEVTVKNEEATLGADTDYTLSYTNNVIAGDAFITITGINDYTGTRNVTFTILPVDVNNERITVVDIVDQPHTGEAIQPDVVVMDGKTVLEQNKDYSVSYTDNVTPGTAIVTITGKGNYTGTRSINFAIVSVEENEIGGTIEINEGKIDWEIDSAGKLTVTGSGEVFYTDTEIENDETCYAEQLPWHEYRELIKSASITVDGITNARSFLYDCYNLTNVNVSGFDTSQVINMSSMFAYCENLEEVIFTVEGQESKFVTYSVLDMSNMFSGCSKLQELHLSDFDTGNVTNMAGMFSGCGSITDLDISNFITSKVTDVTGMFEMCSKLEKLNIQSFDTSNVTNMWALFAECSSLTEVNVSNFDTSKVTDMDGMFGDCSSLEILDLSNFDMKNVTSAEEMLGGCSNLKEIKTPINIKEACIIKLPSEEGYVWHMPETGIVTILPAGLTESIMISKRKAELEAQTYTVTFNSMGGSTVDVQKVEKDGFITKPENSVKEGYTLCGWSKDDTFTKDWDFETDTVQGNITLYARWKENIRDKEITDTGICIEIMDADSCVYTGKAIVPKVKVWDANKVLTEGIDYKVTCKNNVNACDHTDRLIKDSKKPQVIIQGVGAYKSAYKFVEYFSIKQADMAELEITVPKRVAAKTKNKLQKISPVIKTEKIKVAAKNYVVSYYTDDSLTNEVNGITGPGIYYITVEAKKNRDNIFSGNYKGISETFEIRVTEAAELLDKAKVSTGKNLVVNPQIEDTDAVIRTIITQLKIGKSTYKTEEDALNVWKQYFEVAAIDYDGSEIKQDEFYKVLHTAGTKTVVIRAVEGNDQNYTGEKNVKITVKGTKLKKDMFKLTYGNASDKVITQTDYTASSMLPMIYTDLAEGEDYQVIYKYGKNIISEDEIINAGTYTAVISGKNQYSGTISKKFAIKKVNLAAAYKDGKITIVNDGQAVEQKLSGADKEVLVSYDADGNGDLYHAVTLTNADYKTVYLNNKKVSTNGKTAYISLMGKGNFTGTLKGDGKTDTTNTKSGIAKELNYLIGLKNINSSDIKVLVKGLNVKKSKITGAKLEVYDLDKKISSSEYSSVLSETGDNLQLVITGKNKNYTGSRTIIMGTQLTKVTDSKRVKISYKESKKYYYNGETHQPELVIKDNYGNDITDCFVITYGENIGIGKGSITITGKLDKGYCDKKVLKFTILPKWMQWIWMKNQRA